MKYYKVVRIDFATHGLFKPCCNRKIREFISINELPFLELIYQVGEKTFPKIQNSAIFALRRLSDAKKFLMTTGIVNYRIAEGEGKEYKKPIKYIPDPFLSSYEEIVKFWQNPEFSNIKPRHIEVTRDTILLEYFTLERIL